MHDLHDLIDKVNLSMADAILIQFHLNTQLSDKPSDMGYACATLCFAITYIINQAPKEHRCKMTEEIMEFLMKLHAVGWKMRGENVTWSDQSGHTH